MKFIFKIVILLSLLIIAKVASAQTGLDFNGTNQWGEIASMPALTNFTIEYDINHTFPDGTHDHILSGSNNGFNIATNSAGLVRWHSSNLGNGWVSTGYTMPHDTWQHMAWVYDGTNLNFYVNGAFIIQIATNGNPIAAATWGIATNPPWNNANGNIILDNLRVWDDVRTPAEIVAEYQNCLVGDEANLRLLYNFEEGAGTVLTDLATADGAQNANLTGSPTWVTGVSCSNPSPTPNGSSQLILNNNAFVVMNSGAKLVIDNEQSLGISETNGGGMIVSENEDNEVFWHVNENSGEIYVVPFGTKPVSQGGNGVKIPMSLEVTSSGVETTSGYINFSTWEAPADGNSGLPPSVTNGSDALFAVDRFWEVMPQNYSTNPEVDLSFVYDDNPNEIGGSNVLEENNLAAQNYNTDTDSWLTTTGVVDVATRTVSDISLNSSQFSGVSGLWTLVDNSSPLPITLINFEGNCEGEVTQLSWTTALEVNNDFFVIEKSYDGLYYDEVVILPGAGNSLTVKHYSYLDTLLNNKLTYYRLKQVDFDEQYSYSDIIAVEPCSDKAIVYSYPNPFSEGIYINFSQFRNENYSITITDLIGRVLYNQELSDTVSQHFINLQDLGVGLYHISIRDSANKSILSQKLLKQ